MTWASPVNDLRVILSDGDTDKYYYRKKCFGEVNGTNKRFKTFEFRRKTNFTGAAYPLGVWVDGALLATSGVSSDNPESGDFQLVSSPDNVLVEASYYVQWFLDTELTEFLRLACNWLALGDDYTQLQEGLRPCSLDYAASLAYKKIASRWAIHMTDMYLLNDNPSANEKSLNLSKMFEEKSKQHYENAFKARNDFYTRSGQSLQPLFGNNYGSVTNPQPER